MYETMIQKVKASWLPNPRPSRRLHPTTAEVQKYNSDGNGWIMPEIFSSTIDFSGEVVYYALFFTLTDLHTVFHLIHISCWFICSADAISRTTRCTYIFTDAENISATQQLSEVLNNMVAETFFITSFLLPCGCSAESSRQRGSTGPEKYL